MGNLLGAGRGGKPRTGPLAALVAGLVLAALTVEGDAQEITATPLVRYFGDEFSRDPVRANAAWLAGVEARAEAVATCMHDRGFDYVAWDPQRSLVRSLTIVDGGSDRRVSRYGFGISTGWLDQRSVGPDLVGRAPSPPAPGDEVDPNDEISGALGRSELARYQTALYGNTGRPGSGGCIDEGEARYRNPKLLVVSEFGDELDEMEDRIRSDPRMVEAEQKIEDCPAGAVGG